MRLTSHLGVATHGVDIKDWAIGGEERVEGEPQVGLGDLFGEVAEVESIFEGIAYVKGVFSYLVTSACDCQTAV